MERFDTLTGIRGLTALWVILFHTFAFSTPPSTAFLEAFASRGWLGVDLFFVLSGFVIAHVYSAKMQSFSWDKAKDFYRRRLARIYPAHLAVLGLFLVFFLTCKLLGLEFNAEHYEWDRFVAQLFMLNGLGLPIPNGWNYVSWSISSEFAAYLLFPFLAPLLAKLPRRAALPGIGAIFIVTFSLAFLVNDGTTYFLPWHATLTRVLSEFTIGALSYNLYGSEKLRRSAPYLAPLLFALIVLVAGASTSPLVDGHLIVIFALFIPAIAADRTSPFARVLMSKPLVYLGEISFSIYLVQNLVEIVVNYGTKKIVPLSDLISTAPMMPVLLNSLLSIVGGAFLYRFVERQGQRIILAKLR